MAYGMAWLSVESKATTAYGALQPQLAGNTDLLEWPSPRHTTGTGGDGALTSDSFVLCLWKDPAVRSQFMCAVLCGQTPAHSTLQESATDPQQARTDIHEHFQANDHICSLRYRLFAHASRARAHDLLHVRCACA